MGVFDFGGSRGIHLPLAEFSYINNYHSSIEYVSCENSMEVNVGHLFCGQRLEQVNELVLN